MSELIRAESLRPLPASSSMNEEESRATNPNFASTPLSGKKFSSAMASA